MRRARGEFVAGFGAALAEAHASGEQDDSIKTLPNQTELRFGRKSSHHAPHVVPPTTEAIGNLLSTPTKIVGRRSEQNQLTALLRQPETRLVTLLGMGGIGKSTLSKAVGRAMQADFPDGIWFISLAGKQRNDFLTTLSDALGINFHASTNRLHQLLTTLREQKSLLIFDNFEDVIEEALLVSTVLSETQHLKILCTSREALNVSEEWLVPLNGLTVPPIGADNISSYDSVQLFVRQARQADSQFTVHPTHAEPIAHICHFVNGNPLGIELAAAWMRQQSPEQLLLMLLESPDVLRTKRRDLPQRQRSMRLVFEYAWDDLAPQQQQILAALSLFNAQFSAEEAAKIANASRSDLAELQHVSLLQSDGVYFQLHPLVRSFSAENLPQGSPVFQRFSEHFLTLAISQQSTIMGVDRQAAALIFNTSYENIILAWELAVQHENLKILTAALPVLLYVWEFRGLLNDGIGLLQNSLDHLKQKADAAAICSLLHARLAGLFNLTGRHHETISMAHAAQTPPNEASLGWAYLFEGSSRWHLGEHQHAYALLERAFQSFEKQNHKIGMLNVLLQMSIITLIWNQVDLALQQIELGLQLSREVGDARGEASLSIRLCILKKEQGLNQESRFWGEHAEALCIQVGEVQIQASALNVLADLAIVEARFDEAEQLLRRAEKINTQFNLSLVSIFTDWFLGRTLKNLDRDAESEQMLTKALATTRRLNHQRWECEVLIDLARLAIKQNRQAEGTILAEQGLRIAISAENERGQRDARELLDAQSNQPPKHPPPN